MSIQAENNAAVPQKAFYNLNFPETTNVSVSFTQGQDWSLLFHPLTHENPLSTLIA